MSRIDPKDRYLDPFRFCPFLKHAGKPWEEVLEEDRPYVEWLISRTGPAISSALYDHITNLLEGE